MLKLNKNQRIRRAQVVSKAIEEDRPIVFLSEGNLNIDLVVLEVVRDIHELKLDGFDNVVLRASVLLKAYALRLFDLVKGLPVNEMAKNSINSNLNIIINNARNHNIDESVMDEIVGMAQKRGFLLDEGKKY